MTKKNALLFVYEGFCEFEIATAISMLETVQFNKNWTAFPFK
ncbi:hypothetical protein [Bacillus sp. FJAT-27225]|nr:hypothetical protein [Bacillus sp. FJAT-27225]